MTCECDSPPSWGMRDYRHCTATVGEERVLVLEVIDDSGGDGDDDPAYFRLYCFGSGRHGYVAADDFLESARVERQRAPSEVVREAYDRIRD